MVRPWDLVTFDCYGTLIDWESGIAAAFASEAERRGVGPVDVPALLRLHHEIEPAVQAGTFRPYRDVLTVTASRVAARMGWPAGDDTFLADSLRDWRPFDDTNAALATLRSRGYRLAILSNVDRELIERTLEHFPIAFDFVVTAADVRSYKPAEDHFRAGRERAGPDRWVHAAQSWFHDIVPARRQGIPVVWVNRTHEVLRADVRPNGMVADLAGLVRWLEA
jgi:2-haloalkanoic acid dehalogenase type II